MVAFTITVSLGDAEQAALVANELARSTIAHNLEVRSARAQETLSYFEEEERRIADALAGAEAEVSAFKKANEGALPEDLEPGRDALARLAAAEIDLDRQMLELDLRRSELEVALAGGGSVGGPAGLSAGESELQRLELELATRRRVLAPNHPELRQLQEQLEAVRTLVTADGASDDDADAAGGIAQRSASLRHQLDQINTRMDQLAERQGRLNDQRARLEATLVRNPEVEASLHALERQLEQLRERYADVARRHAEARTGAQLEVNRQSERFEILEPALVPEYPVGPNRKKIVVMGAAASGLVAVGLMFLLQMLRPSIRTSAQMERELELRPIVAIPYVAVPGERRRRLAVWAGGVALVAAALWLAAPLIDRVLPLAPLKSRLEQRLNVGPMLDRLGAADEALAPDPGALSWPRRQGCSGDCSPTASGTGAGASGLWPNRSARSVCSVTPRQRDRALKVAPAEAPGLGERSPEPLQRQPPYPDRRAALVARDEVEAGPDRHEADARERLAASARRTSPGGARRARRTSDGRPMHAAPR